VIAHVVAAPVAGRRLVVPGHEPSYVDLDGFVVVVVGRGGPLLPNGVVLAGRPSKGTLSLEGATVWDPTLRLAADPGRLGTEILQTLEQPSERGLTPLARQPSERGLTPLARAVLERDPSLAAAAGAELIGRGPGLTPEGDDVVAGVAAVVASGPWPRALREAWLGALLGADLRRRTSALSATLLELAAAGMGPEPLQALVAGRRAALDRLLGVGHTSGRAYALGAGVGLSGLATRDSTTPRSLDCHRNAGSGH
jgi:hypothetical protein